jgi:hypothetical protein
MVKWRVVSHAIDIELEYLMAANNVGNRKAWFSLTAEKHRIFQHGRSAPRPATLPSAGAAVAKVESTTEAHAITTANKTHKSVT